MNLPDYHVVRKAFERGEYIPRDIVRELLRLAEKQLIREESERLTTKRNVHVQLMR